MRYPMAKTKLATARHEAAHAIVGQLMGGRPRYIQNDGRGRSFCQFGNVSWGVIGCGLTMIAGSVAEHLWHGTPKGLVSAHDFTVLRQVGFKGEDFRVLWEEATRIVRKNKKKIWSLAKKIEKGGRYNFK